MPPTPAHRPTHSEHFSRVADLRPRLRSSVQARRQRFRGQSWTVLRDAGARRFYRVSEPAYHFVALLDGRRSVEEAWEITQRRLGDDAPTQGEAVQVLGQLVAGNLVRADLPPDAASLFARQRKRAHKEARAHAMSFLFLRIPLVNPDRFLTRWSPLVAPLFSLLGFVLWAILVVAGVFAVARAAGSGAVSAQSFIEPGNLPLLYAVFVAVKLFHELGHAFACKHFGQEAGAGEVHEMGVMLLVFAPFPYVDASSSWALRSRRQRVAVAAAGVMAELAIASVAAFVWAFSAPGLVHDLARNTVFIASVSTLLFNGNPLLRYDAYYILSDLIDVPNLAHRSKEHLKGLVKRLVFGVRRLSSPAHTPGERAWFSVYGPLSFAYRVFISVAIILFVATRFPVVGAALAAAALLAWVAAPTVALVRYLATSPELARTRPRAVVATALFAAALGVGLGAVPAPDAARGFGVVEPERMVVVYAGAPGFLGTPLLSGSVVEEGQTLVAATSPALTAERKRLLAERDRVAAIRRAAIAADPAAALAARDQLDAITDQLRAVERDIDALNIVAPFSGVWSAPDIERARGAFVPRGRELGVLVDLTSLRARVAVAQAGARAVGATADRAQIRLAGAPGVFIRPRAIEWRPAVSGDEDEPAFEAFLTLGAGERVLPGQRVVARFHTGQIPLALQWWRGFKQLFQRRATGS